MADPYTTLGLDAAADDAAIRRRYLELTRQFPPEQHPERAAAVRAADDAIKDVPARVRHRLFEAGADATVDAVLEVVRCRTPRPRWDLDTLLKTAAPPPAPPPTSPPG